MFKQAIATALLLLATTNLSAANVACLGDLQIQCKGEFTSTPLTVAPVTLPDLDVEMSANYLVRLQLDGNAEFVASASPTFAGSVIGRSAKILVLRPNNLVSTIEDLQVEFTDQAFVGDTIGLQVVIYDPNGPATTLFDKTFTAVNVTGFERVEVAFFNPATNNTQFSLLRIINESDEAGIVVIRGVDDAGNVSLPVTVLIPSKNAVQLTSSDLESGAVSKGVEGFLGRGVGKWRLTLDSDFVGLKVQSLIRNNVTGTITTVTDTL
jgi:hypothetical protein